MEPARPRLSPVLLLFFLSGATGLIYQVVWVRQFVHVFGATVLAVSTVLAAFMGGLAAGGLFGGRIAGRRARPLATYGVLELVLAAYAGLVPLILRATDPLYSSIYPSLSGSFAALSGVRFLVSVIVLFPPTFLMGATLPLLVEHAARLGDGARRDVARLYATNTFGAVTGTLLASFVLLPSLGLRRTLLFGVGLNLLVALSAIALGRNERRTAHADTHESSEPTLARPITRPVLLGTAAALGFSALAFEVLWTRTLSLAIGTTTYAFAIVLTVFLFGIAAGSALATRLLRDPERAARLFVASPAAIGLLSLALLPLFDRLPDLFLKLSALGRGTFGEGLLVEFLLAALPLLPPTLISGAAFPLAVGIDRARGGASRSVGDIYSANTVGAILGSWIAGFALIPLVGLRTGIAIAAGVLVLATLVLSFQRGARVAGIVTTAVAVAMFALLPQWDRAELTSSGFANRVLAMRTGEEAQQDRSELVFVKEGITTTVSVRSWRGELTMQMNGITEASTTVDLSTQVLVGALPSLLNRSPDDVLVVGLGSGITAAAALRPPSVDHVTCVEISQAVVDGAAFFSETNLGILDDPRCALFVEDARSYLRLSGQEWDCIVSEPSNVWNAGTSALMTREFFQLCRDRMRPNGVLASWVQGYSLSSDALRSVVAAARTAFPRVSVWTAAWGDFLIVAGDESFTIDVAGLLEQGRDPEVGQLLLEADSPDVLTLLSRVLLAGSALDRWLGDFPPNSDDSLYLEFEAPKLLYRSTLEELYTSLHRSAGGVEEILSNAPPGLVERLPDARRARELESRARLAFRDSRGTEGIAYLEEAVRLLPGAPDLRRLLARAIEGRSQADARKGDRESARVGFLRAGELDPAFAEPFANLAILYLDAGDLATAVDAAEEARRREPNSPEVLALVADLAVRRGDFETARDNAERALAIDDAVVEAWIALGDARHGLGDPGGAGAAWREAAARDPGSPAVTKRLRQEAAAGR